MAIGIIEKGSSGLFDNEIEIRGKYATMVRFLKEDIGLFTTFREAYITCAVIGFLNNLMDDNDELEKVQAASIFSAEMNKRKKDFRYVYRLMMLLKEESSFTLDDYKNRAFRDDPEENMDILKENMQIFNSYACGGINYLYKKFINAREMDDIVNVLYEYLYDFSVSVELIEDDGLPDFEPQYA